MTEMTSGAQPARSRQLSMPVQAAPIDRTPAGVALAAGSGVEASWGWDDVKKWAGTAGQIGDVLFG